MRRSSVDWILSLGSEWIPGRCLNHAWHAIRGQKFRADTGRLRGGEKAEEQSPNRQKDKPDMETVDLKKRTQKEIHRLDAAHGTYCLRARKHLPVALVSDHCSSDQVMGSKSPRSEEVAKSALNSRSASTNKLGTVFLFLLDIFLLYAYECLAFMWEYVHFMHAWFSQRPGKDPGSPLTRVMSYKPPYWSQESNPGPL